ASGNGGCGLVWEINLQDVGVVGGGSGMIRKKRISLYRRRPLRLRQRLGATTSLARFSAGTSSALAARWTRPLSAPTKAPRPTASGNFFLTPQKMSQV